MYLKALGIHVYFATIKESYFVNCKYLDANTKAIHTLNLTINDDYLSRVSNVDSAFVLQNILTFLGEQIQNDRERDSDEGSDTFDI